MNTIQEIDLEVERSISLFDNNGRLSFDAGRCDATKIIKTIKEWAGKIAGKSSPHFILARKGHYMEISCDSIGAEMIWIASHETLIERVAGKNYQVEPATEIFLSAAKKYNLLLFVEEYRKRRSKRLSSITFCREEEAECWCKALNDCFEIIRKEIESPIYTSMMNSYSRSMNKNQKSLRAYIDNLFVTRSRILVLRLDLSYSLTFSSGVAAVNYVDARNHRERLIQNMRSNSIFSNILGYAWRLECAPVKGFHYHFMFFFDGSKVREDITRGDMIGEYWTERITDGKGLYYNCNKRKHTYRECGVGMISHDDSEGRRSLIKASEYLTKDPLMKLVIDGRCFGRGAIKNKKNTRGRRRKSST